MVALEFPLRGWSPIGIRGVVDGHGYEHTLWLYVTGVSNPGARRLGVLERVDELVNRLEGVRVPRGVDPLEQVAHLGKGGGVHRR